MAGIGFELEKHFEKDTTFSDTVAYLGAAAVFTGPWAFGTIAIVSVYLQARTLVPPREESLLFALLTFACCVAMHLTGAFTFVITRYLADRLYSGDSATIGPCYAGAWIVHLTAAAVFGAGVLLTDTIPATTAVAGLALIVACTQLWLVGAFITMLRAYGTVAATFAGGYALAALAARWLGAR